MSTVRKPRGSNVGSCSNALACVPAELNPGVYQDLVRLQRRLKCPKIQKAISANLHVDDVIVLGQKLKLSSRISRVSFGKRP